MNETNIKKPECTIKKPRLFNESKNIGQNENQFTGNSDASTCLNDSF